MLWSSSIDQFISPLRGWNLRPLLDVGSRSALRVLRREWGLQRQLLVCLEVSRWGNHSPGSLSGWLRCQEILLVRISFDLPGSLRAIRNISADNLLGRKILDKLVGRGKLSGWDGWIYCVRLVEVLLDDCVRVTWWLSSLVWASYLS